jgi:hypothetical protein
MSTNLRAKIKMTDAECAVFIEQQRTATIATTGPAGFPHLVAMCHRTEIRQATRAGSRLLSMCRLNSGPVPTAGG